MIARFFLPVFLCLFLTCSQGYHYKYWFFPYYEDKKIDTNDREGFVILSKQFAKDKTNIYFKEFVLKNIDPSSFRIINHSYFTDQKSVYYISSQTELKTNSPKAWIIIIPLDLKIWTEDNLVMIPLEESDPKTFRILKNHSGSDTEYGMDANHLYHEGTLLEKGNTDSVLVLNSHFYDIIKTKISIYYEGEKVKGADPATFSLYDNYAKDTKGCFYFNALRVSLFACDPESFKPLSYPNPLDPKISMDSDYAKDRTSVFWQGTRIRNADPESFLLDEDRKDCPYPGACARDKSSVYLSGVPNE